MMTNLLRSSGGVLACLAAVCVTASVFALTQEETAKPAPAAEVKGDPYTLPMCPVSGERLGSMGDPVVKEYEGREVRFCCKGCVPEFEGNPTRYFSEIDEKIVKQQSAYYPLETCIVMSGEPFMEDGEFIGYDMVHKNRLVRFCCERCAKKFKNDPAAYLAKLDEAVKEKQRASYPLKQCVVGGGELGSMGEPAEVVVANRLVRFCCAGCEPEFMEHPSKYLTRVNDAWKAQEKR